jgi:hypothetical protein
MTQSSLDYIRHMKGNHRCIDCNYPQPDWASVRFGVLFCIDCSGKHRSLGVHIDFVRSLLMDSWDDKQVSYMINGGNDSYKQYLKQNGLSHLFDPVHEPDGDDAPLIYTASITRENIIKRYDNHAARNYKALLKARVEGQPVPLEHPESASSSFSHVLPSTSMTSDGGSSESPKRVMMGFGSDPTYDPITGSYLEESSHEQGILTTQNVLIALGALAIITGYLLLKQHGR